MLADLERGMSCESYVEQDECIIAIFRDCTDAEAPSPRSWQGVISRSGVLSLTRTEETNSGGVSSRSPTQCSGAVVLGSRPEDTAFASLACQRSSGLHGGLYLERRPRSGEPAIAPFARIDPMKRVVILDALPDGESVRGLARRPRSTQLWALMGGRASQSRSGIYRREAPGASFSRLATVELSQPTALTFSSDGRTAFVADGRRLFAIDADTARSAMIEENSPITHLAWTRDKLLVSIRGQDGDRVPKTTLLFRARDDLAPVGASATVTGELGGLLAIPDVTSSSVALAWFVRENRVLFLADTLAPGRAISLSAEPRTAIFMPERRRIGFAIRDEQAATYEELTLDSRPGVPPRPPVRLPGQEIRAALWDAGRARLIFAMRTGALLEYDPEARRPFLQRQLMAPAPVQGFVVDSSSVAHALASDAAALDPLL